MITHESNNYKCEKCEFKCNHENILLKHKNLHHDSNLIFKCNECDETFNSEENVSSHVEKNHNQNIFEITFFNPSLARSKFVCQPCGQAFPNEKSLQSHMEFEHQEWHKGQKLEIRGGKSEDREIIV